MRRRRHETVAGFVILLSMVLVFADGAAAAPQPFSLDFDDSLAYEGGGNYGWPGFNGVNDLMPPEPPVRVRLSGEIDDGAISVDAEQFMVEPGSVSIIPFESYYEDDWRAVGPVSGSYDAVTGAMSLDLMLEQKITYESARCVVGPVTVTLSTENEEEAGSGVRFIEGLDGPGALAGSWEAVPGPTGSNCGLRELGCPARQSLLKGPGALGLARGGIELGGTGPRNDDPTKDKFGIVGYEDEGGCLGKRPDPGPGPGPLDPDLSVKLWRTSVGSRQATFRAKLTNTGGPASGVTLCGKALRGPRLRSRGCHAVGTMAEGASFTRRVTVGLSTNRAKRRRQLKRGRLKVTLAADGQAPKTVTRRIRGPVPRR